jgi:D-alanyl-D-alanine carboxypeptidase
LLAAAPAPSEPIPVYTGPTKTGAALIAAVAVDVEKQTPPHRGKKSRIAAKKPDTAAEPATEAKSAAIKHANATPKAAEKPVAATDKAAAKPAKPGSSAKPESSAKPKAAAKPKPAPKSTSSEAKPADQKSATAPRS